MKIDLKEVEKAGLKLEEFMVIAEIFATSRKEKLPFTTNRDNYIKLVEEGLIIVKPEGYQISVEGFQIFRAVTGQKLLPLKGSETNFAAFWAAFPSSDSHGNWRKTRTLKDDKKGSETLYKRIINNREATHDKIMRALQHEVDERKQNSTTSNRMTFMKNSKTWLRTKQFQITLEELENKDEENHDDWIDNMV